MISQGAVLIDGEKANDTEMRITMDMLTKEDGLLLRRGKKNYCRLIHS